LSAPTDSLAAIGGLPLKGREGEKRRKWKARGGEGRRGREGER